MRAPTTGGRTNRWRDDLRRAFRHTPHVTLAVSLLVLVVVNAWWLHEQAGTVDAGRLPFTTGPPALPQPGSTTTSWTATRPSPPTTTAATRPAPAIPVQSAAAAASPLPTVAPTAVTTAPTAVPVAIPVSLRIDDLGVEADVLPVGVAPDGSLEVPDRVADLGWFRDGALPGQPGSAVVVGHVDAAGQGPGAFFFLRDLAIGARISVLDDRGTRQEFEVVARREYRKAELPVDSLFGRGGPAVLTLITCGGEFDATTRSYDSNIVVHAVPVAGTPGAER